jgi:hypothetical protein
MDANYPPDHRWQAIIELTHDIIAWMDSESEDGEHLQSMLDKRQGLIENYFDNIDYSTRRDSDIEFKIKEQLRLDAQIVNRAKAQQAEILAKNSSMRDQRAGLELYISTD